MIIGTITLITILFFGGPQQYFFVNDADKAVKKVIEDKELKKELTADIKEMKAIYKEFNKTTKATFKEFKALNVDRTATSADMQGYFDALMVERKTMQEASVDGRLATLEKVNDDQWNAIVEFSQQEAQKAIEKAEKKAAKKPQDGFEKVRSTVEKQIADEAKRTQALEAVDNFSEDFNGMQREFEALNSAESEMVTNKYATRDEIMILVGDMNEIRTNLFAEYLAFRQAINESTNQEEWDKVIKEIHKVISS